MIVNLDIPDTRYDKYLLDTNTIDDIFHQNPIVFANYQRVDQELVWIPIVTYVEKVRGWSNQINRHDRDESKAISTYRLFERYCAFMDKHYILPYVSDAAVKISPPGTVGAADRRIAACAQLYGFKVVTRNVRDFSLLLDPDQIVDWTVDPNLAYNGA